MNRDPHKIKYIQMRYIDTVLLCLILFCGCSPKTIAIEAEPEADQINDIISDYESMDNGEDQTVRYWPDLSEAKWKRESKSVKHFQDRLATLDQKSLSTENQINVDMMTLILNNWAHELSFESHLMPLNSEGGFLGGIVYAIQGRSVVDDEAFDEYKAKLKALPAYLNQRQTDMEAGQRQGKSSPKVVVNNCIKLINHLLETPIEDLFFVDVVSSEYRNEAIELVKSEVVPAYSSFRDFLAGPYLKAAPAAVGISEVTDGRARYEELVRYFTTFDISPEEVFQTGMSEVKRIRAEMEEIIKDLKFDGDFAAFLKFLRTDPQFYPKSGRELLNRAAWITKEMEGELPKYFNLLPRMPLTVKPVPDALAPNYTGGRYSPGSYEDNRAGQYWVNTYKLESRPYYVLPALSLHEGVPGHHLQIMLAAELEELPAFRGTYISAFGEGWGLYSEFLGKEAGMYKSLYEEFGALTYEMWRACRLVVDPGMHYKGWTREEAVDFMASNTALSMHEVNTEIDRYIGWPGQAVSYKMGELKIRELRARVESKLGDDFDIREFHDKVLENGSVPLQTLERLIDQYMTQKISLQSLDN